MDASSWISIEGHPAQNRILHTLVGLIEADRLECPPEAWEEVQRCPWVHAWIDQYKDRLINNHRQNVDYLLLVGQITSRYPRMSGARGKKEKADPYVLANAVHGNRIINPMKFAVVTNEGPASKRKLPAACRDKDYNVECMTLLEMLQKELPDETF